jgi:hypothetical protein
MPADSNPDPIEATQFITVLALSKLWGCSTTFVYSEIASGALPASKLGGKLTRIRVCDAQEYERLQAVITAPPPPDTISPIDVSRRWGCSLKYVRSLIRSGDLQPDPTASGRITLASLKEYECRTPTRSDDLHVPAPTEADIGPMSSSGSPRTASGSAYHLGRQIRQRPRP